MRTFICATVLALAAFAPLRAAVRTHTVEYMQDATILKGYLAYDDAFTGKRPGVLVIHAWMGITPYEKGRAEQLAAMGYVALAADIYGKAFLRADSPRVR